MSQAKASESPRDIAHKAEEFRLKKNYEKAINLFTQAIELDENYAWAYAHRGAAWRDHGRFGNINQAITDLEKAIELRENYAWAEANLGYTHFKGENFDNARKHFEKAIEIKDRYPWALAHLAETIHERHKDDKDELDMALKYLDKAIILETKYAFAYALRATVSYQLGDLAESDDVQDFETAALKYRSSAQDILKALYCDPNLYGSQTARITLDKLFALKYD